MKRFPYIIICVVLLAAVAAGCKSPQSTSQATKRIERPVAKEVSDATLQTEALLIEAKMQQEAGNFEQAMAGYRQIVKRDNGCAAAHYELAVMLLETGASDSALYHSQLAATLVPENIWYKLLLVDIYEQRYNRKAVASTWESIVATQPDHKEYYLQLANAYLQIGDADHAIDALNRMEKRWGMSEEVTLQKQKIWKSAGKPQNAIRELEKLAKSMPEDTRYSAMVAESYMQQKDYKSAKPYYDKIAQQHPDDEYIHISLANYYKLTGAPQQAIKELSTGFRNPGLSCIDKIQILTSFYTNEEFYDTYAPATFDLVDTIVRYCDDSSSYALFYADILMRRDRSEEALPWIRLYLRSDSSQYEAWEALLICEWSADDSALEYDATLVKTLFPFHTLPYYLLAVKAHNRKDYDTAITLMERCQKMGFRNGYLESDCYEILGSAYYETGQVEKAWKCFDRCLQLQPDQIYVLNNYAYYLSEQPDVTPEQLAKAEQMSRKTIEKEPDNATFLDTYAWILHKMHRDREALSYMKRAIEKDTQQSETLQKHYQVILSNQ